MKQILSFKSAIILSAVAISGMSSCYRADWSCTCYTIDSGRVGSVISRQDFGEVSAGSASDRCNQNKSATDTCFLTGAK